MGNGGCYRGSSMLQLFAFRRPLRFIALALCSASIAITVSPASARPHHGAGRHARAYHAGHHAKRHYAHHHYRHVARASRWERGVAKMQAGGFADANASVSSAAGVASNATVTPTGGAMASSNVVAEARRYLGGNPTGRGSLWCARLMNMVP